MGAPGREKRLLGGVLGRLLAAEHAQAEVEDEPLVLEDELVEGGEISFARSPEAGVVSWH